jgi:Zn-dependent protease
MNLDLALYLLPGLVIGLTLHECSHALAAALLGDRCAARQGRISLNPFRHLSFWGTLALFVLGFGWGKPVPVNLYNFRHPKRDFLLTSLAGPAANLLVCAISLGLVYLDLPRWIDTQLRMIFVINAMLAVFNLVPIPPLDGSRIWPCVIPGMKPVATGRWSLIWMIVLVYILMSGKISGVIHPVLESAIRLLPHHAPLQQPRPGGFPLELAAPQDAQTWYWSYPEDSPDPNEYRLVFDTEESYPPKILLTFLRGNLQRQNWTQCSWDLFDPNLPAMTEWANEKDDDGEPYYSWNEAWIKPGRGLVMIEIWQTPPDSGAPEEPTDISVELDLLTPSNDEYQELMKQYLAVHPTRAP